MGWVSEQPFFREPWSSIFQEGTNAILTRSSHLLNLKSDGDYRVARQKLAVQVSSSRHKGSTSWNQKKTISRTVSLEINVLGLFCWVVCCPAMGSLCLTAFFNHIYSLTNLMATKTQKNMHHSQVNCIWELHSGTFLSYSLGNSVTLCFPGHILIGFASCFVLFSLSLDNSTTKKEERPAWYCPKPPTTVETHQITFK